MDRISRKALIYLHFFALLTYGRRRTSVNFGFIFANLCKLFTQKWSVLHLGTDHLRKLLFLCVFASAVFFDYRGSIFEASSPSVVDTPLECRKKQGLKTRSCFLTRFMRRCPRIVYPLPFIRNHNFARNGTKGWIFKAFRVFSKAIHEMLKKETVNLRL